jgi:hypothetical protein
MKWITLALVGASIIGCGNGSKNHDSMSMTDTAMYDITRTDTTDGGTWSVTYTPDSDPIPMTDNFKLYVSISDIETSEFVSGAEVNASASMPEHNHGMNTTPVVTELENGQYEVAGMQFHMSGHWRIDLEINAMDKTEEIEFHVDCCQ